MTKTLNLDDPQEGYVAHGDTAAFSVNADTCKGFLHVESWDLRRLNGLTNKKADQMLMVGFGDTPSARYTEQEQWEWSENTEKDVDGYKLLRPYHHVSIDLRPCQVRCDVCRTGTCDENSCRKMCAEPLTGKNYVVAIYNVERWIKETLNFKVIARCEDETRPPCPRPLGFNKQMCGGSGNGGVCAAPSVKTRVDKDGAGSGVGATFGTCTCEAGYGDIGCDKILTVLKHGVSARAEIPVGEWAYYDFEVPDPGPMTSELPTLLVELDRTAGDPVLFVKRVNDDAKGSSVKGGVPAVSDYEAYGDSEGFRSRSNYHHRMIAQAEPGRYYVAVFNNDVYIQNSAVFAVTYRVSLPPAEGRERGPPLCTANCSAPNGKCVDAKTAAGMSAISPSTSGGGGVGACECAPGYGGRRCEGTLADVPIGTPSSGTIKPGGWVYIRFDVSSELARAGLTVTFRKDGGHPVIMLRLGDYPTLLENSYVLSTTQHLDRESTFKIASRDLTTGTYIIGVFNMNYFTDDECEYAIVIQEDDDNDMMVTPSFMSIVLVVIMSMFLCLLLSVCKRLMQRSVGRRRLADVIFGRPGRGGGDRGGVAMGWMAERQPSGCPREVIDAIPQRVYRKEGWETGDWVSKEGEDGLDASCSVCIETFEEGDNLRRLPACGHVFHRDCIDEWLSHHTTCPNCRALLVPAPGAASRSQAPVDDLAPAASSGDETEAESAVQGGSGGDGWRSGDDLHGGPSQTILPGQRVLRSGQLGGTLPTINSGTLGDAAFTALPPHLDTETANPPGVLHDAETTADRQQTPSTPVRVVVTARSSPSPSSRPGSSGSTSREGVEVEV